MRILFLAHFYPPEMGGAAARLHGLARWLVTLGHEVTVIAGFPNYPTGVTFEGYRWRLWGCEQMDGVRVVRTCVYTSRRRGSLRRLVNYFSFVFTSFVAGCFQRKADVVIASCPPLFLGLSGWGLGLLHRAPFVFDIRDLWPDVGVEAGGFRADAAITRWGHRLAGFIYRRAHHITPVTEYKRQRLLEKGVPAEKITVISNGVDLDLIPPMSGHATLRDQLGLQGKCVAVYAGLLGIAQRVETVIEAARLLQARDDIHFLIVGDGVRRPAIEALVAEQGLQNVTLMPLQPREKMPLILATADLCIVPLASGELKDAVPSKLLEAWAHERAAVLVAAGESADLVRRSQGGVVVSPGEIAQLADAIRELAADPARRQEMGRRGHEFVRSTLDRPILARQLSDLLEKITADRSHRAPRRSARTSAPSAP